LGLLSDLIKKIIRLDNDFYRLVYIHKTEDSVLDRLSENKLTAYSVGNRKRYATCSGVAWIGMHHIAAVNLYGQHVRIYRVDLNSGNVMTLVSELKEGIPFPENLAVSPDKSVIAIAHSMSDTYGITLHHLNQTSFILEPSKGILRAGGTFHGLDFSPDSKYLAITEIRSAGYIEVIKLDENRTTCVLSGLYKPLKPKSIAFSRDGKYVVIAFAANIGIEPNVGSAVIAIHSFDNTNGTIQESPLAEFIIGSGDVNSIEDCAFLPSADGHSYTIIATDQANDTIVSYVFDADNASIRYSGIKNRNLTFPHGLGLREDGEYVAVANYGDDTLRIYKIHGSIIKQ